MSRTRKPDSAPVEAGLAAWMCAHPEATLREIEQAVDQQLSTYRAALIAEAAQQARSLEPPDCPTCGGVMHRDGRRAIRQLTAHLGEVLLEGQTWRCPACGAGLFPPR
jgi:hypothetical protein